MERDGTRGEGVIHSPLDVLLVVVLHPRGRSKRNEMANQERAGEEDYGASTRGLSERVQ